MEYVLGLALLWFGVIAINILGIFLIVVLAKMVWDALKE